MQHGHSGNESITRRTVIAGNVTPEREALEPPAVTAKARWEVDTAPLRRSGLNPAQSGPRRPCGSRGWLERSAIAGSRHAVGAYDPRCAARRNALARCVLPGMRDGPGHRSPDP